MKVKIVLLLLVIFASLVVYLKNNSTSFEQKTGEIKTQVSPHPLSIEVMRQKEYPGSEIVIEQTLSPGSNYNRYLASYKSEGLKIFALLTVPRDIKPDQGWPVIVFNQYLK